jgi:uncharacterized protein (DUF983 family)
VVLQVHIIARCPKCGKGWLLKGEAIDCRVRCRSCGLLFKVPDRGQMPKAVDIIEQAEGEIYVDEDGKTYG